MNSGRKKIKELQKCRPDGLAKPEVALTVITADQIRRAHAGLKDIIRRTPCDASPLLGKQYGSPVYLKQECLQKTGSFKIRGAYHKIASLDDSARKRGVVTSSAGNHGQGIGLGIIGNGRSYARFGENPPDAGLNDIQGQPSPSGGGYFISVTNDHGCPRIRPGSLPGWNLRQELLEFVDESLFIVTGVIP